MWQAVLVDDETYVRTEIKRLFPWEQYGFELTGEAENAFAAMDLIELKQPDLVITDIRMPEMDGLELISWLGGKYPWMAAAIVSAYNDFPLVREALRLGAVDYLMKSEASPKTAGAFLERIAAHLESRELTKMQQNANEIPQGPLPVRKAIQFIQSNFAKGISLADVAAQAGVSKSYLCRVFPEYTGEHFTNYLNRLRIERAMELLWFTSDHIYEIAAQVGFWNSRYFSKVFHDMTGMTPAEYRKGIVKGKVKSEN